MATTAIARMRSLLRVAETVMSKQGKKNNTSTKNTNSKFDRKFKNSICKLHSKIKTDTKIKR